MTKVEIDLHEDVLNIINKLKIINDTGIELVVPEGAVYFESILNIKLLSNWAQREGKVITYSTNDVNGLNLLAQLELEEESENSLDEDADDELSETSLPEEKIKKPIKLPKIKVRPNVKSGKKAVIILLVIAVLGILGFVGVKHIINSPRAEVLIVVNAQPLARSIQIKVSGNEETSITNKIIRGYIINASVEDKVSTPTTGEKIIGVKAKGEITIFNNTDEEKKFKKGKEVYVEDDDDQKYTLRSDVTVPAREIKSEIPGEEITYVYGKVKVEVEAKEIGKDYNLDKGEKLRVEGESKSAFNAEVEEDIGGGKEETIKIVSQEDLDKLKADLLENAEEKTLKALQEAIDKDKKFISGTESLTISKEEYSHKLDDETEEVSLEQTFSASGLVYSPEELDEMIDILVEDFIPQGFILSTKERAVNVEVLGSTDSTVLSSSEADLQVTLKTYVVTDVTEDTVREQLYGLSIPDAQKTIGSIRNIKTYELSLNPRYPFLNNIPKDADRVNIRIERE